MGVTPVTEIDCDLGLVGDLLRDQHPDLAHLELREAGSGFDNWMFRLGETLAVRLPRRRLAVEFLEIERRWLPQIATWVSIPVPEPTRIGEPSARFGWPWTVVRWIPGQSAERVPLAAGAAGVLGTFLAQLHQPAPADAPRNPYRGVPLRDLAARVDERLVKLRRRTPELDHEVLDAIWSAALDAPIDLAPTWLHGDLHPRNLVSGPGGGLAGIIDWGDLCVGDPACDLAAAWMHFDPEDHEPLWQARGRPSPATLARTRGWALFFGTILLEIGLAGDADFARVGRLTLERLTS